MRIYFDNCCFNRPFDDQTQLRINLETEAKIQIQNEIVNGRFELVWSYILDFENAMNLFEVRRNVVESWRKYARIDIDENEDILRTAIEIEEAGLKGKDALHVACAISARCDWFLTTDDQIINKAGKIRNIRISDPISFAKEIEL